MEITEFATLAEPLLRKAATDPDGFGFTLVEGLTATPAEITAVELELAVALPDKYKDFMTRYGGGIFGFVQLFPLVPAPSAADDLRTANDQEFPDRDFVAVAPVGTGDHWGFPVVDGRCSDQAWFHFHDTGDDELVAADFLEFVARHGIRP